jgi:hypothetical protein
MRDSKASAWSGAGDELDASEWAGPVQGCADGADGERAVADERRRWQEAPNGQQVLQEGAVAGLIKSAR